MALRLSLLPKIKTFRNLKYVWENNGIAVTKRYAEKTIKKTASLDTPNKDGSLIGYARVSTAGQDLASQLEQLAAAGCQKIWREKRSGGGGVERRELIKMQKALVAGDVVIVTRIDRLARSVFDLFGIVQQIAKVGATFRSLAEPWADTATSTGRLMLAVLGGLADVERDLIRTRTSEGRERARAEGRSLGRPSALTPAQQAEAIRRRREGETLKKLAESYNVAISTISKTVKNKY